MRPYRFSFSLKRAGLLLWIFLAAGCAGLRPPAYEGIAARPETCSNFFAQLDDVVEASGVRDAASHPLEDFPYLRTSRFLTGLQIGSGRTARQTEWIRQMRLLDQNGREKEIDNLPLTAFDRLRDRIPMLSKGSDKAVLKAMVQTCATALYRFDRRNPQFPDAVAKAAAVPDEYELWMRVVGLYPLAAVPVNLLTLKARRKFQNWHDTPPDQVPIQGNRLTFTPPRGRSLAKESIRELFDGAGNDILGRPAFSNPQLYQLLESFAPVIVQDVAAEYDLPGEVVWSDPDRVGIDPRRPTCYYYVSYAIIDSMPRLQLNYVFWFSKRAGPASPWIERGHMDGLTVRLTFDPHGSPVMLDVMNNCGCYHFFAPSADAVLGPRSFEMALDPFVPTWLPQSFPDQRLVLYVNSGWHQVTGVSTQASVRSGNAYRLAPYRILEALPGGAGTTRSIFDSQGILKGSDRIEPLLLFSMGISRVGSMRQRGHHALELVGRAHFDDPFLFENQFIFK